MKHGDTTDSFTQQIQLIESNVHFYIDDDFTLLNFNDSNI